ncbi:hypothetical protein [Variovorax sp. J22R115]|uniref:hypothetical protein n=1 Tax=Variovorax sp. J22R115 TaxID=3053509 RepID=UPI002576F480|nr:hypothetical protein [Variovorax sp. J22R115]MDM0049726.1 hypothetical protein [Variovorax sp. J22R115]
MDVYWRHMAPDGVVAFHMTNSFLSLRPCGRKDRHARGLQAVLVHDESTGTDLRRTDWILVARDPAALVRVPIQGTTSISKPIPGLQVWADDFNNLFGVLK